tara:strand:- start:155 stop:361 length:207 start_codon:yes stop_codon:yes gene_type:complete
MEEEDRLKRVAERKKKQAIEAAQRAEEVVAEEARHAKKTAEADGKAIEWREAAEAAKKTADSTKKKKH